MLTQEEQNEIQIEMGRYPQVRAAVPEALKIVQAHRGWVSDGGVHDVAAFLGLTAEEVEHVASFYSLIFRRPVGRHVILICDGVSCFIMGFDSLREHLYRRLGVTLGETTPDERFTLLPVACLGACHKAPAMMVDADLHTDLTPQRIDAILERYE